MASGSSAARTLITAANNYEACRTGFTGRDATFPDNTRAEAVPFCPVALESIPERAAFSIDPLPAMVILVEMIDKEWHRRTPFADLLREDMHVDLHIVADLT